MTDVEVKESHSENTPQVKQEPVEDNGIDVLQFQVSNIGWLGNIFVSVSPYFLIKSPFYTNLIFYFSH